jgi:hypothetical protein
MWFKSKEMIIESVTIMGEKLITASRTGNVAEVKAPYNEGQI